MPAILTQAREAFWNAVDNWPPLRGYFQEKLRFDSGKAVLPVEGKVGFGKVPAIAVWPTQMKPVWKAHRIQSWEHTLECVVYTPHWRIDTAERVMEQIVEAAYQCGAATVAGANGSVASNALPTYIEAAGCGPVELGTVTFKKGRLGESENVRVTETVITFILRPRTDPQGNL